MNSTKNFKGNLECDSLEHLRIGEKRKEKKGEKNKTKNKQTSKKKKKTTTTTECPVTYMEQEQSTISG